MSWLLWIVLLAALWVWFRPSVRSSEPYENTRLSKAQWANMLQPSIEIPRQKVPFYEPVY